MKAYILLSFLMITVMSFGQESVLEITQEGEDFNFVSIFSELDFKRIPTGILHDKIFTFSQIIQTL